MNALEAKGRMKELGVTAKSIYDDTNLTLTEKKERLDKVEVDLKEASQIVSMDEQLKRLVNGGEDIDVASKEAATPRARVKSLGQQVVDSLFYKEAKSAETKSFQGSVDVKTVNTIDEGTTISGGFLNGLAGAGAMPDYLPGVVDIKLPPLVVADLFAQGTTESALISYLKETAFQNNAAGTSEKGAKPQSDDTFARVTAQVGKISHFLKITDEMMQDAPALVAFLNSRLVMGIQQKEQTELLSGSGYPSVGGVLNASGLQTTIAANDTAQPTDVDAVFQMLTNIRVGAWLEPDAIIVNPADWQTIRLRKDNQGQYYAGGPFTGAYGNGGYTNVDALWGVRVVITPAVPAKTMLVGAFGTAAQIFRRQGVTVEMTNSNQDDFNNGLISVRADERLALAIYRAGAFGKVTLK